MSFLKTAVFGFALVAAPAFAESHASGDAAAGEKVFAKCKACHSVVDADGEAIVKGGRNGPNLYGVFNRVAGTEPEFDKYGDDLIAVGAAGLQWNEEDFVAYASDPRDFLREKLDDSGARSNMAFKLPKEEDARNVWAFLVSVGPEPEMDAGMDSEAEAPAE